MFLNWISALIKAAVLKGFREAVEELDLEATPGDESDAMEFLKERMTALPAPNGELNPARKSK